MKIGIDGLPLAIPFHCGIKHYAEQLIFNLAKIDSLNEYFIFSKSDVSIPSKKNFKLIKIPNYLPILKRQWYLPHLAKKYEVDIFHHLDSVGSIFTKGLNLVTTVHDINLGFTYPLLKFPINRPYCEILRWFTFKNTKMFITDTEVIKNELSVHLSKMNLSTPVKTVLLSYDKKRFNNLKFRRGNFFLAMGDFAYRKNVKKIIESYSNLPDSLKHVHKLKIVASTNSSAKKFKKLAGTLELDDRQIQIVVNPTNKELARLYNRATAFVRPSLYEGFDIPILEAMACGCPVITSNYGVMKETAGNSALFVDPRSTTEITDSMIRIIESKSLRDKLVSAGLRRSKQFSWENTARETLLVYKSLYKTVN